MNAPSAVTGGDGVGTAVPHESAGLHVSGAAWYLDDIPLPADSLHAAIGMSTVAHGRVLELDLAAVTAHSGVQIVMTARDLPAANNYGAILADDPIFADGLVQYVGQSLFAVGAASHDIARRAVKRARVRYEELPAVLDLATALARNQYVLPSVTIARGEPARHLADSPHRLQGTLEIGGQDHFYLEGQAAAALPQEDGSMVVHSSTQHPSEVQHLVAHALGLSSSAVTVLCRRMGGGFGGKESQPALIACVAAVLARRSKRAVKLRLDRDDDMTLTGKRHDFLVNYDVGFDALGRIRALSVVLASRCGYSADLSGPVNDRAMCHVDNAYFLEHVEIVSHRCKTHTQSNTAFRGFGGPQGMMAIEAIMDAIARVLGLDPLDVRRANFYGIGDRNVTPYGMTVEDNLVHTIVDRLEASSDYRDRRRRIAAFNATSPVIKRGIALTPVKFGISFNATHFNQAGALLHLYTDGSLLLSHGGTEMGQGLYTKVAQVVAQAFGVPAASVRTAATDTSKVPNTSATAASSGADLNGKAAQAAALTLQERLVAFLAKRFGIEADSIRFAAGQVFSGATPLMTLEELARAAYAERISMSATGYYRTPKIHWDRSKFNGRPFFYFAYGAAVAEVALDTLTGEHRLLRVDILHDVGQSLNPAIDVGQVEGAFLQGMGWLTSEELWWNARGELMTHSPSTYKIPTAHDWPVDARVALLENSPNIEDTIHRSKAVGEPPLMLAMSVFHALRDAVASVGGARAAAAVHAPATPERLLRALNLPCREPTR